MKLTSPILLVLLLFVCSFNTRAQFANSIWHFGDHCTLRFEPGGTYSGDLSYGYSNAGCASVASIWNETLFYTNGINVRNRYHAIMPHADSLMAGAGTESTQGVAVTQYPKHDSTFIIFTTDQSSNNGTNGLRYSVLDMRLDSTRGDIEPSHKNIPVYANTGEHLSVAMGRYGSYYWVVSHIRNTAKFAAFLVDSAGVHTTPVLSADGSHQDTSSIRHLDGNIGQLKFNSKYNMAAVALYGQRQVQVFSFNNATGKLQLLQTIPTPAEPYGVEFDPYFNCLYYSLERGVYQVDLSSSLTDIQAAVIPIGYSTKFHPFGDLQIAPDGKIYTAVNDASWLSAFTPFAFGSASTFQDTAIVLTSPMVARPLCKRGLPNYIVELPPNGAAPGYDTSFVGSDSCNSGPITFTLGNISNVNYVQWFFGESATSNDNSAVGFTVSHQFSSPGRYKVLAVIHTEYFDDTIARYIDVMMCDSVTGDAICKTYAANAFTPNNDGQNDEFKPVLTCPTDYYRYSVYDRWGERIFYTEDPMARWNGTYKDKPCQLGVYYYVLNYKFINGQSGVLASDITLVR